MWLPVWDNALLSTTSYNIRSKVITMNPMNLHQMLFQICYIHTYFYHYFYYISRNKKQFFQCKVVKCIFLVNYLFIDNVSIWLHNCLVLRRRYSVSKRLFNWRGCRISPRSYLDIKIYLRYHLCWVINFNTLIGCSSVQNQLKAASQWKDSILT